MKFDTEYWERLDKEIPGWMAKEEAEFLVENVKGEYYLEIGVAYGKSYSIMKHHFPDMHLYGIDLINHGVECHKKGAILYGDANGYASGWEQQLDTIFIDGAHTKDGVLSDFVNWYNRVKPGGEIIFHDYMRPTTEHKGVGEVVDFIKPMLEDFKSVKYICAGTKPN